MGIHIDQRLEWYGEPLKVTDLFRLHRAKCGGQIEAACRILTHQLGWELRLEISGSLQRSQVYRSQHEVLETSEAWKLAMIEKGWS
jgi:hypothetical protein